MAHSATHPRTAYLPSTQFSSFPHQETGTLEWGSTWLHECSSWRTRRPWEGWGNQWPSGRQPDPTTHKSIPNTILQQQILSLHLTQATEIQNKNDPMCWIEMYVYRRQISEFYLHDTWTGHVKTDNPSFFFFLLQTLHLFAFLSSSKYLEYSKNWLFLKVHFSASLNQYNTHFLLPLYYQNLLTSLKTHGSYVSTHLSSVLTDTLPKWLEDTVKGLNAVGSCCLSKGSQSQGSDGSNLLLLIHQTCTHVSMCTCK